jgi:hypothetical protein
MGFFYCLQFSICVTVLISKLSSGHISIIVIIISQILYFSNSALNFFLNSLYSKKFFECAKEKFPFVAKIITKFKVVLALYLLLLVLCALLYLIIAPSLNFCVNEI